MTSREYLRLLLAETRKTRDPYVAWCYIGGFVAATVIRILMVRS